MFHIGDGYTAGGVNKIGPFCCRGGSLIPFDLRYRTLIALQAHGMIADRALLFHERICVGSRGVIPTTSMRVPPSHRPELNLDAHTAASPYIVTIMSR